MVVDYITQFPESQDLVGSSKERPSNVLTPIPPIKTQVLGEPIDLEIADLYTIVKNMGHVTINFSAIPV